jgi:hypothetical protein
VPWLHPDVAWANLETGDVREMYKADRAKAKTGDPTTNAAAVVGASEADKKLEVLSDELLLRKAIRESLITPMASEFCHRGKGFLQPSRWVCFIRANASNGSDRSRRGKKAEGHRTITCGCCGLSAWHCHRDLPPSQLAHRSWPVMGDQPLQHGNALLREPQRWSARCRPRTMGVAKLQS